MVKSPGKISGHATAQIVPPAPPPLPSWPKKGTTGDWKKVGPWGIGDDIEGKGEAGTLADAVSPAGNPKVIYTGGRNNGASSGLETSLHINTGIPHIGYVVLILDGGSRCGHQEAPAGPKSRKRRFE